MMADRECRRRRPATACNLCRRRKTRCNREMPCNNCLKSRKQEACVYEDEKSVLPRTLRSSRHNNGAPVLLISPQDNSGLATPLAQRPKSPPTSQQEVISTPASDIETRTSQIGGTFHIHHPVADPTLSRRESSVLPSASQVHQPVSTGIRDSQKRLRGMSRNISHKTRLFGQSHWFNTLVPLVNDLIQLIESSFTKTSSQAIAKMQKCKSLARTIKAQRAPPWPCPPTPDLPPKDLADKLVENYFATIESVYRVLHVPIFRREYGAIWTETGRSKANNAFLVQVKLVMALGALVHDDTFSLRSTAVRWIYEAQTYLAEPVSFKARLNVQTLQTRLLLLLAREFVDINGDSSWVEVESIVRVAMSMGLHRDPDHLPRMAQVTGPPLQSEMRRRLWNTILELSLQASLFLGGPPRLSEEDFDCGMPGNFDDEELLGTNGGGQEGAAIQPQAEEILTSMTVPRALRSTFSVRLRVVKFLNDLQRHSRGGGSYAETLELDKQLRAAFEPVCQSLKRCNLKKHATQTTPGFALQAFSFILERYTSALHAPFLGASFHESAYAFSRRVMLDTTLRMWCAAYPSSFIAQGQVPSSPSDIFSPGGGAELFSRFILCAAGFFRTSAAQATFLFPTELRAQLQESLAGLGHHTILRMDLLKVVEEGKEWSLRCLEAGETNAKGHMTSCLLAAHVEGLRRGLGEAGNEEALGRFSVKEAEAALDRALEVLEGLAARTTPVTAGIEGEGDGNGLWEGEEAMDFMELNDWDFSIPDAMLFSDDQGVLTWEFGDGSIQNVSL